VSSCCVADSEGQRLLEMERESRSYVWITLRLVQLDPSAFDNQDNSCCCGWNRRRALDVGAVVNRICKVGGSGVKLTKRQHNAMKLMLRRRNTGVSFSPYVPQTFFLVCMLVIAAYIGFSDGIGAEAAFIYGVFTTALFETIINYRRDQHVWPAHREVIDWDKLTELVESHEGS